ncbi:MAG: hypothetical protein Q4E28_05155 [Clostridia bacterium]|nr:hypothetical protein [Clostridia bacterium]
MNLKEKIKATNTVHKICSIVLIIISIFAIVVSALGFKDAWAIKTYMEKIDVQEQLDQLKMLKDGLKQIQENEKAYFDGAVEFDNGMKEYTEGKKELEDGKKQLAAGRKELAQGGRELSQGAKDLRAGQAEYDAGKRQLEEGARQIAAGKKELAEGKKQLAEGKKQLAEHKQEYEEGKQMIADSAKAFEFIEKNKDKQWFINMMSTDAMIKILNREMDLDIPLGTKNVPAYLLKMRDDGIAQLKEYEDGLVQVAEGEKQIAAGEKELAAGKAEYAAGLAALKAGKKELDQGYADYAAGQKQYAAGKKELADGEIQVADGEKQLADGEKQLADGKKQLAEFETGVAQIKDGLKEILALEPVYSIKKHEMRVKAPVNVLGEIDYIQYDNDGKAVLMHDKNSYITLGKANQIADAALKYAKDSEEDATKEIMSRVIGSLVFAITGILGMVAGIIGLFGRGHILAIITAIFGLGVTIYGGVNNFLDYAYPLENGAYSGDLQAITMIVFAIASIVIAAVLFKTKSPRGEKKGKRFGKKKNDEPASETLIVEEADL